MAGTGGLVKIRPMEKRDLTPAVQMLARAFATNPNTLATNGGKPASPEKLEAAFMGRFKHLPGKLFVAELDNRIVGAMRIVEWPGCQASMLQTLKMLPSMAKALSGLSQAKRGMKILNAWKEHDPKRPHWHLDPIGVDPDIQRNGIGGRLMEHYCRVIDERGMEAYHETDRTENVPFYEVFGFKVVGEQTIIGAKNWYMLHPAKSSK